MRSPGSPSAGASVRSPLGHAPRDAELEDEQLLEREPLPAGLRLAEVARAVHRRERVALQRQPLALAQLGGQRIGDVRRERERASTTRRTVTAAISSAAG